MDFFNISFFKDLIYYLFLEKGRREKEGEGHQCVDASYTPATGDLACNPGMCPDWESNCDPLVCSLALNTLNHTSQGKIKWIFNKHK